MNPERLAWQLLSEPPKPHVSFINPAPKPRPPAQTPRQEPPAPPPVGWNDLVGQASILQRTSERAADKMREDLRKRGMLMTEVPKPLNFDEALDEVCKGRWVSLDEVLRQKRQQEIENSRPVETCGSEYSD